MKLSELYLIGSTGINAGNYYWWNDKTSCDDFFLSRQIAKIEGLSVIRFGDESKNGYNVQCVHIPMPLDRSNECDYISFKTGEDDRIYHAQVTFREYVNEKSTRLYFAIDYVASYFDTIDLGECLIERTHVEDDWWDDSKQWTASNYLLPEPIKIDSFYRADITNKHNILDGANDLLKPEMSSFNLVAFVNINGELSNPKIDFQCGGSLAGFVYSGTKESIEEKLSKYISFQNKGINKAFSVADMVSDIYIAPNVVINESPSPFILQNAPFIFTNVINQDLLPPIRYAKVYDYFALEFVGMDGSYLATPKQHPYKVTADIVFSGSPQGNLTLFFKDENNERLGEFVKTLEWAKLGFSQSQYKYNFNLIGFGG